MNYYQFSGTDPETDEEFIVIINARSTDDAKAKFAHHVWNKNRVITTPEPIKLYNDGSGVISSNITFNR